MDTAIKIVGGHHRFDVGQNVLTGSPRHGDDIGGFRVNQRVSEHLRLVGREGGEGGVVKGRTEDAGTLEVLPFDVHLLVNLVVGVHRRHDSEAHGIGGEGHANESGGILGISDDAGADVGHGNVSVIVDDGHLQGLAHRADGLLLHFRGEEGVALALLNEEVKRPVLTQTVLILVKFFVLDANGVENCCG